MLESPDLADQFVDIATNFRGHDFHCSDVEIWINEESATDIYACGRFEDSVCLADKAACI